MTQKTTFLDGEGDAWFERNRETLSAENSHWMVEACVDFIKDGDCVLEIGCGNGRNLSWLSERTGSRGWGIDPSQHAIEDGRGRFPTLNLVVGTADKIAFDGPFDFILLGFCLYLCDREDLPTITSAVHAVLRPGGFVGIVDFDAPTPVRRHYHHLDGVWSYKMDYSLAFLAYPQYSLARRLSGSHSGPEFTSDPSERVGCTVLSKGEPHHGYALEPSAGQPAL